MVHIAEQLNCTLTESARGMPSHANLNFGLKQWQLPPISGIVPLLHLTKSSLHPLDNGMVTNPTSVISGCAAYSHVPMQYRESSTKNVAMVKTKSKRIPIDWLSTDKVVTIVEMLC